MSPHERESLVRHPSVTVAAAAELVNVDIPTIRGWASSGAIVIEERGDLEIVRLDEVRALASRERAARRGALRDRLRQADEDEGPATEVVNIGELQELARRRES